MKVERRDFVVEFVEVSKPTRDERHGSNGIVRLVTGTCKQFQRI